MSKKYTVFLDSGHGGKDPGALGNNLKEKDINLSVVKIVGEILKKHNIEVIYSRTTDVFLELHERTRKANTNKADIFVSVHCNSASNANARGVETFHYATSKESARLAKTVQDSLVATKLYSANRGVKTANFHVIRASNMPAALVELGFINNVDDAKILKNKQDDMANAVAKGILEYLGIEGEGYKVKKVKVNLNGRVKEVDAIEKDGNNFIKLQDLRDDKIIIDYDAVNKIPIIRVK